MSKITSIISVIAGLLFSNMQAAECNELADYFDEILVWTDVRESAFGGDYEDLSPDAKAKLDRMVAGFGRLSAYDLDTIRCAIGRYLLRHDDESMDGYMKRYNIYALLYYLFEVPNASHRLYPEVDGKTVIQPMPMIRTNFAIIDFIKRFDQFRSDYERREPPQG